MDCRDAVDRPAVGERHDPFELWILDDSPEIVRTVHREAPVDGSVLEDADSCGVDENGDVAPGPVGSADSQDISIGGGDDGHPEVAVAVACDAARDEEVGVVRKPYHPHIAPEDVGGVDRIGPRGDLDATVSVGACPEGSVAPGRDEIDFVVGKPAVCRCKRFPAVPVVPVKSEAGPRAVEAPPRAPERAVGRDGDVVELVGVGSVRIMRNP